MNKKIAILGIIGIVILLVGIYNFDDILIKKEPLAPYYETIVSMTPVYETIYHSDGSLYEKNKSTYNHIFTISLEKGQGTTIISNVTRYNYVNGTVYVFKSDGNRDTYHDIDNLEIVSWSEDIVIRYDTKTERRIAGYQ